MMIHKKIKKHNVRLSINGNIDYARAFIKVHKYVLKHYPSFFFY
jgi:hypothetical protein